MISPSWYRSRGTWSGAPRRDKSANKGPKWQTWASRKNRWLKRVHSLAECSRGRPGNFHRHQPARLSPSSRAEAQCWWPGIISRRQHIRDSIAWSSRSNNSLKVESHQCSDPLRWHTVTGWTPYNKAHRQLPTHHRRWLRNTTSPLPVSDYTEKKKWFIEGIVRQHDFVYFISCMKLLSRSSFVSIIFIKIPLISIFLRDSRRIQFYPFNFH